MCASRARAGSGVGIGGDRRSLGARGLRGLRAPQRVRIALRQVRYVRRAGSGARVRASIPSLTERTDAGIRGVLGWAARARVFREMDPERACKLVQAA